MAGGASDKEGGDGEVEGAPTRTRNGACAKDGGMDGGGEVSCTARAGVTHQFPTQLMASS